MSYLDEFNSLRKEYRILISPTGKTFLPQIKKSAKRRQRFFSFILAMLYKYPKENELEFLESLKYQWIDLGYSASSEKEAEDIINNHIKSRIDSDMYKWNDKYNFC